MTNQLRPSVLLSLALACTAMPCAQDLSPVPAQHLPIVRAGGVLVDAPRGDGVFWVRGDTYKARLDVTGVTFLPLFPGAKAHTPIHFRLAGADAAPERIGQSFRFRHSSGIEERWEPGLQGMEQLFVLATAPGTRDLALSLEVTTDLQYAGYRSGVVFSAPSLGEVTYGEGVVFDARGERATLVPAFETVGPAASRITLRVSESFLAHAEYPITVDPFVSNFAVTTNTRNQLHPDVVHEPLSGDFVVVYEDVLNSSDTDILGQRFRPDGTLVGQISFDLTNDLCIDPKICATRSGSKVIAIWDNESSGKGIQARAHSLSLNTSDPVAQVTADGTFEDSRTPDIGGGITLPTTQLGQMAVFVRRTAGVNFSLRGVQLQSNGIPTGGEFVIDGTPGCDPRPDIAPSGGVPLHWGVVWQKHNAICNDPDIWWAPVNLGGLIQPATEVEGDNDDETNPRVFTAGSDSLVCWVQPSGSFGLDADAVLLRRSRSTFAQVGPKISLTAAEPGAPRAANQASVAVGFDGCRHTYAYMEDQRPRAACVAVANGAYLFTEGHVSLSSTTNNCGATAMAYVPSDASPVRYAVVWQEDVGSHFDVRAAFYDGRLSSGGVSVVPTACGRVKTGIRSEGTPAIGHRFEVSLSNVGGVPVIVIGPPVNPITLCFVAPTSCQLGVSPIIATIPRDTFSTILPCDPSLVGGVIGFQGLDVNATTGCTFGVPLRTTDTLAVTLQ